MDLPGKSQSFRRFDQVQLRTSKHVTYMSAPPGTDPTPAGIWSVAAIINDKDLLCVRNSVVIRIPATDVLKVADYNINNVLNTLGKLSHGKNKNSPSPKVE